MEKFEYEETFDLYFDTIPLAEAVRAYDLYTEESC